MPTLTVRNLPDTTHRALRMRAAKNGNSTEAEVRSILSAAVDAAEPVQIGSALRAIGKRFGGVELKRFDGINSIEPASYE